MRPAKGPIRGGMAIRLPLTKAITHVVAHGLIGDSRAHAVVARGQCLGVANGQFRVGAAENKLARTAGALRRRGCVKIKRQRGKRRAKLAWLGTATKGATGAAEKTVFGCNEERLGNQVGRHKAAKAGGIAAGHVVVQVCRDVAANGRCGGKAQGVVRTLLQKRLAHIFALRAGAARIVHIVAPGPVLAIGIIGACLWVIVVAPALVFLEAEVAVDRPEAADG